ncbi:MAG: tRNA (adenosine(37)-N6)-threonylcarbamoyltransferase complex transferase subunit TsaD [Puniceicoccales bacterium]|jgi:N6-L-threonylcarbamoyladenine synthase|nr:tRNA (adenosine(37)-N6)-threonylcarbamoyltransferase complex transferase subunit TsaD [Puniceicoccales bacterium]
MRYLGLESSCDESAIAIWETGKGIVYEQVLSQVDSHSPYGGVMPSIAIREHLVGFQILLEKIQLSVDLKRLDGIGVTHGPGLMGCLGVGLAYAQSLQLILRKPLMGINHLQGHALSPFMAHAYAPSFSWEQICPHLGLLVSGGNTLLFKMTHKEAGFTFEVLAQTQDDAAGEALDKGARLLGFSYPGGPLIEQAAKQGDAKAFQFPEAFKKCDEWQFSFSGLKTSLRYFLDKHPKTWIEHHKSSICAAYEEAIVNALTRKVSCALQQTHYQSLGLSGGVANNERLRHACQRIAQHYGVPLFLPEKSHCGDNASMIAFLTSLKLEKIPTFHLNPNLKINED